MRGSSPRMTSRERLSDPMPATPSDLFALLDRLGIAHATVTHPALFTVEQSQQLRGTIPGGHTKNLFLKDKKGTLFLVTALEDAVIELKSLHRRLAASGRFSFGPADLLRATLGIEPGAVTPFAAMNRSEEHTSELQSLRHLVCRLLLEKKKKPTRQKTKENKNKKEPQTTNKHKQQQTTNHTDAKQHIQNAETQNNRLTSKTDQSRTAEQ